MLRGNYLHLTPNYKTVSFLYARFKNGSYYGMAMSVRPSVCPSVRLSVRPLGLFSGLFFNTYCRFDLKLGACIYLLLLQIKFAFCINWVAVTYFMAKSRSHLYIAIPAKQIKIFLSNLIHK